MFFYISKIFSGLLFPLPLLLSVFLLVAVFYKKKHSRKVFVAALLALYSLCLYPVAGILIGTLEKQFPGQISKSLPDADAIVLLGGMVNPAITTSDGEPEFVDSVDRIIYAATLFRMKKAPLILISGGSGLLQQQGRREADLLKEFLINRGIPSHQILIENQSRNTYENALNSAQLAPKYRIKHILLVTSAFHMQRSKLCFEAQGFIVTPASADFYYAGSKNFPIEAIFPAPSALRLSTIAIKEYIGLLAYYVAGYLG